MTATKPTSIEVTGTVEKCEMLTRKPFRVDRYSPAERLEFYLSVTLRLKDGSAVYFNTPAATRNVASCPGAAVVTFNVHPAREWMKEEGDIRVATREHSNNNHLVPLLSVGEILTVSGRVKADTVSRIGNRYKSLTHVKRK